MITQYDVDLISAIENHMKIKCVYFIAILIIVLLSVQYFCPILLILLTFDTSVFNIVYLRLGCVQSST